jgi:hypothetical protein
MGTATCGYGVLALLCPGARAGPVLTWLLYRYNTYEGCWAVTHLAFIPVRSDRLNVLDPCELMACELLANLSAIIYSHTPEQVGHFALNILVPVRACAHFGPTQQSKSLERTSYSTSTSRGGETNEATVFGPVAVFVDVGHKSQALSQFWRDSKDFELVGGSGTRPRLSGGSLTRDTLYEVRT